MTAGALALGRRYLERGIPVFPLEPNGKRPTTPHGLHDATCDAAVLKAWLARWPAANVGVPTGRASGLLVIDLDVKRDADGRATLAALERALSPLPPTLASATPSGGEHRWFRMPATEVRNSAGRIGGAPAPGVDVRGEGGYVVAPPSAIEGRAYTWIDRRSPAALPATWIEALAAHAVVSIESAPSWQPSSYRDADRAVDWCERALEREVRELRRAPHGTRNDRLWRAAAALGGLVHTGALVVSEIGLALRSACAAWPASERDERKDAATIARGIAWGIAHPRTLPDLGGRRVG